MATKIQGKVRYGMEAKIRAEIDRDAIDKVVQ